MRGRGMQRRRVWQGEERGRGLDGRATRGRVQCACPGWRGRAAGGRDAPARDRRQRADRLERRRRGGAAELERGGHLARHARQPARRAHRPARRDRPPRLRGTRRRARTGRRRARRRARCRRDRHGRWRSTPGARAAAGRGRSARHREHARRRARGAGPLRAGLLRSGLQRRAALGRVLERGGPHRADHRARALAAGPRAARAGLQRQLACHPPGGCVWRQPRDPQRSRDPRSDSPLSSTGAGRRARAARVGALRAAAALGDLAARRAAAARASRACAARRRTRGTTPSACAS